MFSEPSLSCNRWWLALVGLIGLCAIPGSLVEIRSPKMLFKGPDATVASILMGATGLWSVPDRLSSAFASLPTSSNVLVVVQSTFINDQLVALIIPYLAWPLSTKVGYNSAEVAHAGPDVLREQVAAVLFVGETPSGFFPRRQLAPNLSFVPLASRVP